MPGFNEASFRAESDLSSLIEAEKIKKDSKRLKAAMAKGRERRKDLDNAMDKKGKKEA